MRKPFIGIPTGYDGETKRYGQDRRYLDAIEGAGGVALLIPVTGDTSLVESYAAAIEGLLLPGSSTDVDPVHYGSQKAPTLGRVFGERDHLDFMLLDLAETRRLPVLGICYGAQSLNVFRGGGLVQDIPAEVGNAIAHDRKGTPEEIKSHTVAIEEGSRLEGILGTREARVNSYHHQSVARAGRDLRVVAVAPDGVVEAIEDSGDRLVVGVQWHPETGWDSDPLSGALFAALVESAIIRRLS